MCESPLRAARDACVAEYGVRSCFRFLGRCPPSSAASLPLTPMGVLVCLGDGAAAEGLDGERTLGFFNSRSSNDDWFEPVGPVARLRMSTACSTAWGQKLARSR